MCGTSTRTTQQQQAGIQSTTLPVWATQGGQNLFNEANSYAAGNPYSVYSGPTEGQFGNEWGTAADYAGTNLGQTNPNVNASNKTLNEVLGIAGDTAGKSISDLMSPYVSGVLAPTLDAINKDAANRNNATAAGATMAGAFGDSGFGVQKALDNSETQKNIAGATSSAYNTAFNDAIAQRNQALQQLLSGASGLSSNGGLDISKNNALLSLLSSMGSTEQGANQTGINTDMLVNAQKNTGQLGQFATLQSILRGAPMDTTTTSQTYGTGSQTMPDNSLLSLGGQLGGAALTSGSGGSTAGRLLS
jgi:hypothetical protein